MTETEIAEMFTTTGYAKMLAKTLIKSSLVFSLFYFAGLAIYRSSLR